MPSYFDSSVLLSLVLGDAHAERAGALWASDPERVSSLLLEIECLTVMRRVPAARWPRGAQAKAQERLVLALDEVTLKRVDDDVVGVVRETPALSGCRALDAVHVASALYFQAASEGDLRVCTFDARMAEVAARVGLLVVGPAP